MQALKEIYKAKNIFQDFETSFCKIPIAVAGILQVEHCIAANDSCACELIYDVMHFLTFIDFCHSFDFVRLKHAYL